MNFGYILPNEQFDIDKLGLGICCSVRKGEEDEEDEEGEDVEAEDFDVDSDEDLDEE